MNTIRHKYESGYVESDELIGKPNSQSVFRLLKSLYVEFGNPVECTKTLIIEKCGLSRNTIANTLDDLAGMNLISYKKMSYNGGFEVEFNADEYVSLVSKLSNIKSSKERKMFLQALHKYDFEQLKSLGYARVDNAGEKLGSMYAKQCSLIDENSSIINQNSSIIDENSLMISQNSSIINQNSSILKDALLEYFGEETLFSSIISQNSSIISQNSSISGENLSNEQKDEILDEFISINFNQWYQSKLMDILVNFNQLYKNKYKRENKKKYNKEISVLSRKNQSSFSGDSANLDFFDEPSSFLEKDNSQPDIQANNQDNSQQKDFEIEIETSHFDNNVNKFLELRKSNKYLSYEKFEFDDIIANPTEHQLPEERLIQEVWKELENEREYSSDEESDTAAAPFTVDALDFIKNYLLRAYFDLKDSQEDSQLTIQEAYSIFDFDVTNGEEGEALFIIQSDKIKNISAKASTRKKHKMTSREKRELNITYMDKLIEIGTNHPDEFTEFFSAMDEAMFDFYEQVQGLSQIHKIQLSEMADHAIDQLGIEKTDFMAALNLKEDNHKTYSLRYDFLVAERVIEWNKTHNQESKVEQELNKTLQN